MFVAIAACYVCREMFAFDPERVPVALVSGGREPVCRRCVRSINDLRAAAREAYNLPPIVALAGAYGEES